MGIRQFFRNFIEALKGTGGGGGRGGEGGGGGWVKEKETHKGEETSERDEGAGDLAERRLRGHPVSNRHATVGLVHAVRVGARLGNAQHVGEPGDQDGDACTRSE